MSCDGEEDNSPVLEELLLLASSIAPSDAAEAALEYDMVDASGRVHTYTLSGEGADGTGDFYSGLVSLGAAGIVARMVLQAVPQFKVKQCPFPNGVRRHLATAPESSLQRHL